MRISNTNFVLFFIPFFIIISTLAVSAVSRPDAHAPIGVMGDHLHGSGEWMFSYRYMFMSMDGNRDGTDEVSTSQVLEDFMVSPTDMDMQMHMFGLMYAPTENLTMMAMLPYIKKSMNHRTRMGGRFKTTSEGFGDLKVTGLYRLFKYNIHKFHLNLGMSFPTGSIDEEDDTPAGDDQQLPYPMQLGSGTFDLLSGVTYLANYSIVSWGGQILGTVRLGENDNDYTLGDRFNMTTWGAVNLKDWVSLSSRLNWDFWGDIDGADPQLNPVVVPTADPDLRSGNRLDMLFGLNFINRAGPEYVRGHRLAVEFGFPVYQDLDGPQLETDWVLTFGWQYAFEH